MILLIDLLHPTEFHFFQPIIKELQKRGNKIIITTRKEEILISLLDYSGLDYTVISTKGRSQMRLAFELISRTVKLMKLSKSLKIDMFLGMSTLSISIVGKLIKKPTILFTECEDMGLKTKFVFKLATKIYTPEFFKKNINKKHTKFNGLLQLNYLHPNYFKPNKELVQKNLNINLENEKYFILRFCDWKASHDIKQRGFSKEAKLKIIEELTHKGRVYILDEKNETEFQKYRVGFSKQDILHLLAFSSLTITETTSISIESALLGVPVVRCTTMANTRMGGAAIFEELEANNLVNSYSNENEAYLKIRELLEKEDTKENFIYRRNRFIEQFDQDIRKTILKLIESNLK